MKKIVFDMRMMKPFPTGIGNHYLNLIKALIEQNPEDKYILVINSRCKKIVEDFFKGLTVDYVMIDINGGSLKQILKTFEINKKIKNIGADIVVTDIWSSLPYMSYKYVLMVYDLIGFHKLVNLSLKQRLFDIFLYKRTVRNAEALIASTNSVKTDLINFIGIEAKKIKVVMPSVSPEYAQNISNEKVNEIIKRYGLTLQKYFIYIGNRRPHKNLMFAIESFNNFISKINDPEYKFVLVGSFDDSTKKNDDSFRQLIYAKYPQIKDNIIITGRMDNNADVAALLKGSRGLFHPSLFEGFGLTPLEAIFSGTAVVASNINAIKDVIGDAGILLDPKDLEANANALLLIAQNDEKRNELLQKSIKIRNNITWENAANSMSDAIYSCL